MLTQFILFSLLLLFLFLLSPQINTAIYQLTLIITRSKKISLAILIIFLLPGTIIHELSHFIVATILFIPSGELTIFPKIEEGRVKAGSLHHADTDPIRRSLIGIAPMLIGITMIYIIGSLLFPQILNLFIIHNSYFIIQKAVLVYLLFITSISMFSSRKDLEVAGVLFPLIFIVLAILYFNGLRISFTGNISKIINNVLNSLNFYLLITFGLDLGVCIILKVLITILQKLFKIKLIKS